MGREKRAAGRGGPGAVRALVARRVCELFAVAKRVEINEERRGQRPCARQARLAPRPLSCHPRLWGFPARLARL